MVDPRPSVLPYESLTVSDQIKERPILFSGAMVRALLDGSKTQTRRIVKPHPSDDAFALLDHGDGWWPYRSEDGESANVDNMEYPLSCQYGQPGEHLWVRETWAPNAGSAGGFLYSADHRDASSVHVADLRAGNWTHCIDRWKPSIHMPRLASRILLEIVSVRVERLNDCSQVDAIAEGAVSIRSQAWDREHFPAWRYLFDEAVAAGEKPPIGPTPMQAYEALWESINGAGSWAVNPWVWVVEFKRVEP